MIRLAGSIIGFSRTRPNWLVGNAFSAFLPDTVGVTTSEFASGDRRLRVVNWHQGHGPCLSFSVRFLATDNNEEGRGIDVTKSSFQAKSNIVKTPNLDNDANLSPLTVHNPTWDQNIAALLEYNESNGTVNIPDRSSQYPNLGRWVYNLRRQKGLLTEAQRSRLDSIGFLWGEDALKEKQDRQWEEMFTRLKKYKEKHGDCLVPQHWDEDPQLGGWVMRQRVQYGNLKLREDYQERLRSIDFVWRLRERRPAKSAKYDERWMERYYELTEYRREHNDCEVPSNYHNKKLANWVHVQRQHHKWGNLRWDRVRLLDAIGFTWSFQSIHEKKWHKRYEEVKAYYDVLTNSAKQQVNSPDDSESKKAPVLSHRLRTWITHQRSAEVTGSLDPSRKALLDAIDFEWRE